MKSIRQFVLMILLIAALNEVSLQADNWPNWMGPNHDGVSLQSDWSTRWPTSGLSTSWVRQIGTGFSSVSIVGDQLFTMGHSRRRETVWCLNVGTGDVIWQHSYPAELNNHLYEGGPGSTPTVDGEFVYTLSVDGRLLCLQRDNGTVVWEVMLQDKLDVEMHEWGFNSSPRILGRQLLVECGRLASFDKITGALIWASDKHQAGYGSVVPFDHEGTKLLASLDCEGLRISDSSDGSEVAFHEWRSPFRTNSTTPIIVGDTIYISTGYNVGCGLFRLTGNRLEKIYSNREMRNHFNNSILLDGYLYGFDGNSNLGRVVQLTCMKYDTGEVMWQQRGLGCGSLMIADGKLVILSEKGDLVIADASPDGYSEIARSSFLEGRCWTVPVLLDGHIFGRNADGKLVSARLPTTVRR